MDGSSLQYITCDELRELFSKCCDDIEKRILIIDVRDAVLFNESHLCLDIRHQSISSKMRVMNIDPEKLKICTTKNILSMLNEPDLRIFKKRKDASEVVVIGRNTDDIVKLADPRSKVVRLIKALTIFDNETENKITVPIQVLEGGYREWLVRYPHFTTNSNFDPDTKVKDLSPSNKSPAISAQVTTPPALQPQPLSNHFQQQKMPLAPSTSGNLVNSIEVSSPPLPRSPAVPVALSPMASAVIQRPAPVNKPVPTPPRPSQGRLEPVIPPKPTVKNAPGTAVPINYSLLLPRPTLPRSHSSPNVAQAEGDELELSTNQLDQLALNGDSQGSMAAAASPLAGNHVGLSPPQVLAKPRFDRTLKPAHNSESINLIRAQINFGRSPETSGKAITGLQNLGNTCFMNSVIQCLAYAPTLEAYFCSNSYYTHVNFNTQYGTKGELAIEFGALVEKLNSHRYRYIEPKSFRDAVTKHIGFAGNEQQDSHEFMMMLFDKLHHDLNIHGRDKCKQQNGLGGKGEDENSNINTPRATLGYQFWKRHLEMNKSVISDLFEGIFMSTLTCTICKGQSNTFEVFNCLSLPIPSESRCHVRDCLSHFSNPERIEAAWECPRCKLKREADKKIVIYLTVDCTNVLPQSAYGPVGTKTTYSLCSVVNHFGHLDGGHYTAFCKLENQRWYQFDDSNVSEMRDADVCGQAAYILFYATNS